jgi:hypothetical protein
MSMKKLLYGQGACSEQQFRKTFLDQLPGPNENRFVPFNDIPASNSKYVIPMKAHFGKLVNRDKAAIGAQVQSNCDAFYNVTRNDIQDCMYK